MKILAIFLLVFGVINCQNIPDDICEGVHLDFRPHPTDCTSFILCIFEEPTVVSCTRPGDIFDPNTNSCVPGDPITCEIFQPTTTTDGFPTLPTVTDPTTTTTVSINTTLQPPPSLPTLPSFPTFPTLPTTTTPPPPPVNTTTPPPPPPPTTTQQIPTTPSIPTATITTPTLPTTTTTTTWGGNTTTPAPPGNLPPGDPSLCIGNNFRFVADPNYCFRFFYCMFGVAVPGECDRDRIFSERWRGCVLGDWETCTPNFPIITLARRQNGE